MALKIAPSSIQTAHYGAGYWATLLLVLASLSSVASRAANAGSVPTSCVCTTQVPSTVAPRFDSTGSYPGFKEVPTGANTILLPAPSPTKLAFKLSKRIKMADQQVAKEAAPEVPAKKEAPPKEVDKEGSSDRKEAVEAPPAQDNIVFPKDDEPVGPTTTQGTKTSMPIGNRILIGGMPNDGYGRDANGDIVEIFE